MPIFLPDQNEECHCPRCKKIDRMFLIVVCLAVVMGITAIASLATKSLVLTCIWAVITIAWLWFAVKMNRYAINSRHECPRSRS